MLSRVQAGRGGGVFECDQAHVEFINNIVFSDCDLLLRAARKYAESQRSLLAVQLPARLFLALFVSKAR